MLPPINLVLHIIKGKVEGIGGLSFGMLCSDKQQEALPSDDHL